jgi:hypothetical protein
LSGKLIAIRVVVLSFDSGLVLDFLLLSVLRLLQNKIVFFLIQCPSGAVGIFVVPGASATRAQGLRQTARKPTKHRHKRLSGSYFSQRKAQKVFHRFPQDYYH